MSKINHVKSTPLTLDLSHGKEQIIQGLTSVAHLTGLSPARQKVTGSTPDQGMRAWGAVWFPDGVRKAIDQCFPLVSMFLSLSFSLIPPLSKTK